MRVVKSMFEVGKWYASKLGIKQRLIAAVPGRADCLLFWSPALGARYHHPSGRWDFYAESETDIMPVPVPPPPFLEEVVLEKPE